MDDLAAERLLQPVKHDSLRWHSYYSCWQCLPSRGGGWGCRQEKKIRKEVEEMGEKEVNTITLDVYYVSKNSHRENIVSVSECPWRGFMKDCFILILRRSTKDCRQGRRTIRKTYGIDDICWWQIIIIQAGQTDQEGWPRCQHEAGHSGDSGRAEDTKTAVRYGQCQAS